MGDALHDGQARTNAGRPARRGLVDGTAANSQRWPVLTLGHEADVVPKARRFARASLPQEAPEVLAAAELVVSELVTNAFLYGEPPITLRFAYLPELLRLEVGDAGEAMPVPMRRGGETMTGRGLSLVNSLCSEWGAQRRPEGGKLVWAELPRTSEAPGVPSKHEVDIAAVLASWSDLEPGPSWYTIRLGSVPTELLLSAKAQMDNVVRELTLVEEGEAARGSSLAPEVAALVRTVTHEFAEVRAELKVQAVAAAARGELVTDLRLHVPASVVEAGERYLEALDKADRYARSGRLLTLAPPVVHRIFRRWYVRSLVEQVRGLSGGQPCAPVRPFGLELADEVGRLSHLEETGGAEDAPFPGRGLSAL